MSDSPSFPSQRALVVLAVLCGLGFATGAAADQLVARWIALPDDATTPEYTMAEPPQNKAGNPEEGGSVASGSGDKGADLGQPGEEGEGEAGGEGASRTASRSSFRQSAKSYAEIIVRRNIFDSTAVYTEPGIANGNGECKSDSNMRLLATMVVSPMEYSTALVTEGASRDAKARPYKIGDSLGSDGKITLIEQKRVCTEGNTCLCMDQAVASRSPEGEAKPAGASEGGIEQLADGKYQVDRSLIDEAMGNVEALATQIRATPHKGPDGQIDGFRLSAVRSTSLFGKLGIKNGDIIHAVNGTPLTSSEGAMAAYGALKNSSTFTFEITRRNQKMTMEYTIR